MGSSSPGPNPSVLGVVQHAHLVAEAGDGVDVGRDRTIAFTADRLGLAGVDHLGRQRSVSPRLTEESTLGQLQRGRATPGTRTGRSPTTERADLAPVRVGVRLDDAGELDLQPARQVEVVLRPHDVGHAAFAGLGVNPDHSLVAASHIERVDRQVGCFPSNLADADALLGRLPVEVVQALLDRVLMAARERRVDQVARVRMARVDRKVGAVLHGATDVVDPGEVDLGVDALREQVHPQRDQVDVAGPLAVAEQASLHPVGSGHHGQFGGRGRRAPVVVRVQRDGHVLAWSAAG